MSEAPARLPESSPAAWYGLGVLTLVLVFATVDRQIFLLLAEPIKTELGLSDFQIGLLQGVGFSVFGALASFPIGWLADRHDRRTVMALCILLWSVAVAACSFAQGFVALFIAGALVGIGEAGLSPITLAMLPDLFRGRKRQTANSIFTVTSTVGAGVAAALCSAIILLVAVVRPWLPPALQALSDWRLTFLLAVLPAPLFIAMTLSIRMPQRRRREALPAVAAASAADSEITLAAYLRDHWGTCFSFALGMAAAAFGFSAIAVWLPQVAIRQFGATPASVGTALGIATTVAVLIGMTATIGGASWLRRRLGPGYPVWMVAFSAVSGGLVIMGAFAASSLFELFVIYGAHLSCIMLGQMCFPTAIQGIGPGHLRAQLVALVRVFSLIGGAVSPPLVGALSDRMPKGDNSLLLVTVSVAMVGLVTCAAFLVWCARHYPRTIAAVDAIDAAAHGVPA